MEYGLLAASVISVLALLLFRKIREFERMRQGMIAALNDGISLERGGWHLYWSKASKGYILLQFNKKGRVIKPSEKIFPSAEEAVLTFLEQTSCPTSR